VPRLLVLCRHPYHLPRHEARAWLKQELEAVVRRDRLEAARLTRLVNASAQWTSSFDWLLEFRVDAGASGRTGACGDLLADLRLLGMGPVVVLVDDRDAVELRRQ
jgi:hypothetical protein